MKIIYSSCHPVKSCTSASFVSAPVTPVSVHKHKKSILLKGQTEDKNSLFVVNYQMITYINQRHILYTPPPFIILLKKKKHWHIHHAHIHTQLAAQVLDSCHALPDFWLGLPRVSCHPAEFYRGVQPAWRTLCEGWGMVGGRGV